MRVRHTEPQPKQSAFAHGYLPWLTGEQVGGQTTQGWLVTHNKHLPCDLDRHAFDGAFK